MAIDSTALSRPGMVNSAGGDSALYLQVFSGEVLAAFNEKNFVNSLIMKKNIRGAKSATFPKFGRIPALHHAAGNSIFQDSEGGQFNHAVSSVSVDDLLIAATTVDEVESLRNYYEVRAPYMVKIGNSLASQYDRYALQAATRAARMDETNSGNQIPTDMDTLGEGGFVGSLTSTDGASLLGGLFTSQTTLDEKDVPDEDRFAPLRPATYSLLVQNKDLLNRDYGNEGNGIFFDGIVFVGAGFRLIKTNHIPSTNVATNPTGARNIYTGDFTALITTVFHREAIGAVWLIAPAMETPWLPEYQVYGLIGKMAQGVSATRPECAVELSTAATQPVLN